MGPLIPNELISFEWSSIIAIIIGMFFGFILEASGFSSSRKLAGVFYGYDFAVLKVFFTAAIVSLIGLLYMDYLGYVDMSSLYVHPTYLWGAIIGGALVYDLTHPLYTWQLYTTIRLESPMSWGAWVLLVTTPLSFMWVFSYYSELFPKWKLKFKFLKKFEKFLKKNRKNMAYALVPLSIILGVYTGILLSAFNARPLWNNAILGPLFLTSGLSTGAATIILLAKNTKEIHLFSKVDLALIIIELGLIVHMIMGMYAGSEVQLDAMNLLIGGEFTLMFFGFVVILGLIVPGILEALEIKGYKVPVAIPAILILIGGLIFRFVMVEAGQITRYLY